jgi:formate dehydrogenase major subunit
MTVLNITVNGQKIQAQSGQTLLEAATAAGIEIPVLCHHPALPPEGACRVCLVEIEKQRSLQPSCTFPVSEGMVVHTESERVVAARKFALELLFSERIHYCMYCPLSGDEGGSQCELQRLAYRYGLTNWRYSPNYAKSWAVDASRKHFVMDHSRCILCRRCVRACDLIVANHTLGVRERGARTLVIADDDVPFGQSTCVSCGTCLQVCPTGALIDRRSAYMGSGADLVRTATTCMACPVGCGIEAVTRSGQLVRVDGDWGAANGGLLCVHGRFGVVEPQPERVTAPMVRRDGAWVVATWEEALVAAARGLKAAGSAAGLASPRATNEELAAFRSLLAGISPRTRAGLLYGEVPPPVGPTASLADLEAADVIVVAGGQPLEDQKVVGYIVRRAVEAGAKLILVADAPAESTSAIVIASGSAQSAAHREASSEAISLAGVSKQPVGVRQMAAELDAAERPVVLYAAGLLAGTYDALRALPAQTRFLPLYRGTNAAGAAGQGLSSGRSGGDALFLYASDDVPHTDGTGSDSSRNLPDARFTVVQAAYRSEWTEHADVILPAQTWTEKNGHVVNIEGRELPVVSSTKPPAGLPSDVATLASLASQLS